MILCTFNSTIFMLTYWSFFYCRLKPNSYQQPNVKSHLRKMLEMADGQVIPRPQKRINKRCLDPDIEDNDYVFVSYLGSKQKEVWSVEISMLSGTNVHCEKKSRSFGAQGSNHRLFGSRRGARPYIFGVRPFLSVVKIAWNRDGPNSHIFVVFNENS